MRGEAIALGIAIALGAATARADEPRPPEAPLVFVADPNLGVEGGVRTIDNLTRFLFRYERVVPDFGVDESRVPGKILGVLGRIGKWVFVDTALADLETTAIHEIYGHGARARDFGESPSYAFRPPGVYCAIITPGDDSCSSITETNAGTGARDRDLLVIAGGTEANFLTAWWVEQRMVASNGWMHHDDFAVWLISKLSYSSTLLSSKLDDPGGITRSSDDISQYVGDLQDRFNRFRPEDRATVASRLRRGYLWNFFDPMWLFATYGTVEHLAHGDRYLHFPMPRAFGANFYPSPRFMLSPFGAEHYLDLFVNKGPITVDTYGRVVSSGLTHASGVGARAFGIPAGDRVAIGAEVDVWNQPQILLDVRSAYVSPQVWGVNVGASADVKITSGFGLTARLAYKTSGWLAGQPIDAGVHGYGGVVFFAP